jgi:spermidine synthase
MPLYESNLDTTKSVIATFFEVFPNGILFSNERDAQGSETLFSDQQKFGYDAILFAQVEPPVIDLDALRKRLDRPDHERVKQSLLEVGYGGEVAIQDEGVSGTELIDLFATYAGQAPLMKDWTRDAQINTDRNLRLQYLAGLWLNTNMGARTLNSILEHYRFPAQTFVGSTETIDALKQALHRGGRKEPASAVKAPEK